MSMDIDKVWDTDEISETSTVAPGSSDEEEYAVEAILAEKVDDWDDKYGPGKRWLVKWEGYGMHESVTCWEPLCHFAGGYDHPALASWNKRKASMSKEAFRKYMQENEDEYEEASYRAEEARLARKAKRAKKRAKATLLRARTDRITIQDSEDEEVVPVRPGTQAGQQRKPPLQVATKNSGTTISSSFNSLFDGSSDSEASLRRAPQKRRPRVIHSESSSSESSLTADSLIAEIRAVETLQTPPKHVAMVPNPNPTPKSKQPKAVSCEDSHKPSSAIHRKENAPKSSKQSTTKAAVQFAAEIQRKGSKTSETSSAAADKTTYTTASSGIRPGPTKQSSTSTRQSVSTMLSTATKSGLKFVNQPKQSARSGWKKGDKPFSTLHFRAVAEKRSRIEGTPDIDALRIVNHPSAGTKAKGRVPGDDLYGRRETVNRPRVDDSNHNEAPVRGTINLSIPLAPWETEKVPMVCNAWRLSSNCPKTARDCWFMHRNKDPNGRDYPVHDGSNIIPPKYRRQPLTCSFWLRGPIGCTKSSDECIYAHRNTGFLQNPRSAYDAPIIIDSEEMPPVRTTNRVRRADLTCWFWAKGICRNSADDCIYQHYHTGKMADKPPGYKARKGDSRNNIHAQEAHIQDHHDTFSKEDSAAMGTGSIPGHSDKLETNAPIVPLEGIQITNRSHHNTSEQQPQPVSTLLPPPPPSPPPFEASPPKIMCTPLEAKISSAFNLDFKNLFTRSDGDNPFVDRRAFLIYHPEQHMEELALITRWLMIHHVQIGSALCEGAWEDFRQQINEGGSGIVMAHPDFDFYTELPGFGAILCKEIRVWSIGLQEGFECDSARSDNPPVIRHDCIEVFPVGGFIYITDEVFEKKPLLALKIIQLFCAKVAQLRGEKSVGDEIDDADLLWRLCVRPELMEYLLKHCEDHEKELEAGDDDMQSRAQLYTLLSETGYIEQDDPTTPLSLIPDKFPILSERREVASCQPVDYFGTLARSPEAANLHMIRYYAGLQVDLRRDFRQFFVVHTEPSAPYVHGWMEEIQTIAAVITPEQCVEEFTKDQSESMFDFCERYLQEL
ncbi:chromo domain-containing [Pyrenophora seminiperda CCB06]|uniref:Chromo domain-containing n=1 Tax=Pyrenophora seminiperda CCB06 TaxID=1302712 RepID=A0A3M7LYB6_9PLEO|nr:chromo domain-containing [Pyrenophora seminiperda CCB06]